MKDNIIKEKIIIYKIRFNNFKYCFEYLFINNNLLILIKKYIIKGKKYTIY